VSFRRLALSLLAVLVPSMATAQVFVFDVSGVQEVPPVATDARGGCHGVLDQGAATFSVTCVHDVTGSTAAHIHRAPAGVNGPIVFNLGDPASPIAATWSGMSPADVADLLAGNLYVNVHSAALPAGEIRGQILPRTVDTVYFTADGAQSIPPSATTATATCTADLDGPATSLGIGCTHDVPSPTAATIHAAPPLATAPLFSHFLPRPRRSPPTFL
jgi:hypothetical protein